ncbi:MAG: Na+/H+ antiporter [Chloroflexota bacterium]
MTGVGSSSVEAFLGLLILVALVAAVVRVVRIPYTVALVLTGLALAFLPDAPRFTLTPNVILTVFLPVLLFYGAYNLNLTDLRSTLTPITVLAIPGVIATAGLVGTALHAAAGLSWPQALLFGTIVAATDPVAVLAIFGELGAPRRLATLVAGESLFNDGTALVFFTTMLGVVTAHTVNVGSTIQSFLVSLIGSLALGAAVGLVGSVVLQRIDDVLLEMTLTLIIAYGGYLAASHLGLSGPLETVAAGLLLGARGMDVMSPTTRLQAGSTWEFLDFMANSLLFLLMGLALRPIGEATSFHLGTRVVWPLVVAIVAVTLTRVLVVWVVHVLLARIGQPLSRGWPAVLTWAGLRGAVSFAAALSLPADLPNRDLLLALTFGVVLFTLLVQGLTIRSVLDRCGIGSDEMSRHDLELALGRLRTIEAATHEIEALRRTDGIDQSLGDRLLAGYTERRQELRNQIEGFSHHGDTLDQEHEHELRRRLLRIQQEASRAELARGQISQSVFREIAAELDRELGQLERASDPPASP